MNRADFEPRQMEDSVTSGSQESKLKKEALYIAVGAGTKVARTNSQGTLDCIVIRGHAKLPYIDWPANLFSQHHHAGKKWEKG